MVFGNNIEFLHFEEFLHFKSPGAYKTVFYFLRESLLQIFLPSLRVVLSFCFSSIFLLRNTVQILNSFLISK